MVLRAALYLRISKVPTGSRQATIHEGAISYSVEDQEVRCRALCRARGVDVVKVYYDDGISAYRSLKTREGYSDMRAAVTAAVKEWDLLVFDRQDRLQRDQIETLRFIADCAEHKILWESVDEGSVDLSDPMQVLFAVFRGGNAEGYSEKISTNVRRGNVTKRTAGLPAAGGRPFGFESDKITIRQPEADLIRRGTEMLLDGKSRAQVLKMFKESGLTTVRGNAWLSINVRDILTRWRNCGWTTSKGNPVSEAVWPAIVTKDQVEAVRAILVTKGDGTWCQPVSLCSGLARCSCGQRMRRSKTTDKRLVYRCVSATSHGQKMPTVAHAQIAAPALDDQVRRAVLSLYALAPEAGAEGDAEATRMAELYRQRAQVERTKARWKSVWLNPESTTTESEYITEDNILSARLAELTDAIAAAGRRSAHAHMLVETQQLLMAEPPGRRANFGARYGALLTELGQRFDDLDLTDQRRLVQAALTITVHPGRDPYRVLIDTLN